MTASRPTPKDMNAAALQERQAYQAMRDRVPDLHLPVAQRAPLNRAQANAVANYGHARDRVLLLRAWFNALRDSDFTGNTSDRDPQGQ